MENQNFNGASKDLVAIIKEDFKGKNKVYFMISERGNQRIEIKDEDTGEIWNSLEAICPALDMSNFDEISANLLFAMFGESEEGNNLN